MGQFHADSNKTCPLLDAHLKVKRRVLVSSTKIRITKSMFKLQVKSVKMRFVSTFHNASEMASPVLIVCRVDTAFKEFNGIVLPTFTI